MFGRWLIGVGWVAMVAVGGAVIVATGGEAASGPPAAGRASPATSGTAPGGSSAASSPASPTTSAGSPGAGSSLRAGGTAVTAAPGSRTPAPLGPGPQGVAPAPDDHLGGPAGGGPPSAPARVAAVSSLLDIVESIAKVGPGIANGAAATVLSAALKGLPGPLQETVASGTGKLSEQLSIQGPQTIEGLKAVVAQLAAANPDVNAALSITASALSGLAVPAISPLDRTARQLSEALAALGACPVAVALTPP